jgi:undecaprenyl-diphosphatase
MTITEAVILAVVEGITEYLPVSSTGHMILTEAALKMQKSSFTNVYIVNIQFGAIVSVLFLYWKRFFQSRDFYFKLFVAFLPAAVLGFLLNDFIDSMLESVLTVAVSLLIGGFILIFIDKYFADQIEEKLTDDEAEDEELHLTYTQAFIIGLFQCIAMIPGVSRSASAIIGGLTQKLKIKSAAEFSFFLAVPTIGAAAVYKLYKGFDLIRGTDMTFLIIGNIVSFIVGMLAIQFFIGLISKYGLRFFGYYRIAIGALIIALYFAGVNLELPGEAPKVKNQNEANYIAPKVNYHGF